MTLEVTCFGRRPSKEVGSVEALFSRPFASEANGLISSLVGVGSKLRLVEDWRVPSFLLCSFGC